MDTKCPKCGATNTVKLSVAWSQGTSTSTSVSTSWGSIGSKRGPTTRTTHSIHSSLFAQQCAPPAKPFSGLNYLLLASISLVFGVGLYSWHSFDLMAVDIALFVLFVGLYFNALTSTGPIENRQYLLAQMFWRRGWVCRRCSCKWVPERRGDAQVQTTNLHKKHKLKPIDHQTNTKITEEESLKMIEEYVSKDAEAMEKKRQNTPEPTFDFICPKCGMLGPALNEYCGKVVKCSGCMVELKISDDGTHIFPIHDEVKPDDKPIPWPDYKPEAYVVIFHRETLRAFVLDQGYKLLYPLIPNAVVPPRALRFENGWLPTGADQRPKWIHGLPELSFTTYWYEKFGYSPRVEDIGVPAEDVEPEEKQDPEPSKKRKRSKKRS